MTSYATVSTGPITSTVDAPLARISGSSRMRCLFEALNGVAGSSREKRRDLELVRDAA